MGKDQCQVHCYNNFILPFTPNNTYFFARLVQIYGTRRQKSECGSKLRFCSGCRKHSGKRENAGYQYFLLFPQCFQKASFIKSLKVEVVF